VVEYLVRQSIVALPLLMAGLSLWGIVGVTTVAMWYARFYHGNIRTNLGPLRYVLVTPQSHRLHHSIATEHRDVNFGAFLSIWDRLFGTQHSDDVSFPPTGLRDEAFPHDESGRPWHLILNPARQFIHPFVEIARSSGRLRAVARTASPPRRTGPSPTPGD
jgi:sterol desaturase/sphingolipid hydroxylase (fatty acid hydroxylase superfamily)